MSLSNEKMVVRAVLLRGFILVRKGWCQRAAGVNENGATLSMKHVEHDSREPVQVCAVGALARAEYHLRNEHNPGADYNSAKWQLDGALLGFAPAEDVIGFNDWDATDQNDVLALYKRAIRLLEEGNG